MRILLASLIVVAVCVATPAMAQTVPAASGRAFSRVGVRAYFLVDSEAMAASRSFDAVLGSSVLTSVGGGGEVLRLWKELFARAIVSNASESGQRVFVIDNVVVPLGIPLEVSMRTLELGAGWRAGFPSLPRVTLYGGGGLLWLRYREQTEFADPAEDTDESFVGQIIFGGLEGRIRRSIVAGLEVQYRRVDTALGAGGVSSIFHEDSLGGTTVRVLVGVRP